LVYHKRGGPFIVQKGCAYLLLLFLLSHSNEAIHTLFGSKKKEANYKELMHLQIYALKSIRVSLSKKYNPYLFLNEKYNSLQIVKYIKFDEMDEAL
jgi:hypothetical protein